MDSESQKSCELRVAGCEETLIGEPSKSQNIQPAKRFSILDGSGATVAVTDDPIIAYAQRCSGRTVIDHANGGREYDGTNPANQKREESGKKRGKKVVEEERRELREERGNTDPRTPNPEPLLPTSETTKHETPNN